jgi:hypothetical protein
MYNALRPTRATATIPWFYKLKGISMKTLFSALALVALLIFGAQAHADTLTLNVAPVCGTTQSGRCVVYQDATDQLVLFWEIGGNVTVTDIDVATGSTLNVYATNLFRDPKLGLDHEVLQGAGAASAILSGSFEVTRTLIRSGHNYYVWRTKFLGGSFTK